MLAVLASLDEIDVLVRARVLPRTPSNYRVALSRLRPGEQHVRRGPYKGGTED
jgi:hypothetical protein